MAQENDLPIKVAERLMGVKEILTKKYGLRFFDDNDDLLLLPKRFLSKLPDGFTLTCIDRKKVVVGKDEIDDDTRFGLLAFGVVAEQYLELLGVLEES